MKKNNTDVNVTTDTLTKTAGQTKPQPREATKTKKTPWLSNTTTTKNYTFLCIIICKKERKKGGLIRPQSRKSNSSFGVISSTSHNLNTTSKETPTLPNSIALIWLRSISTNSASLICVKRFRLR